MAEQLTATHGAVKMLHTRVRLILDYLKSVRAGKTKPPMLYLSSCSIGELTMNCAVLREISSLCDQLPVLDNKLFEKSFQDVINSYHVQ